MEFIKYSLIVVLLIHSAWAQQRFSSKECLDANYKMSMLQDGPFFGLMKQEFTLTKNGCIIKVNHKKFLPKEWVIDVCREPVHIKVTSVTGVDVAKKINSCIGKEFNKDTGDFCSQYVNLMEVIQDDGLIFAEGDRDDLSSNHGKTYCSYLLIDRYLKDSIIFSRYTEVPDIFVDKVQPIIQEKSSEAPEKNEVDSKSSAAETTEDKSN